MTVFLLALGPVQNAEAAPASCRYGAATIVGTEGDDVLTGRSGADVIVGFGGADTIRGQDGDDLICGGDGDDLLSGGEGRDYAAGGAGADDLRLGPASCRSEPFFSCGDIGSGGAGDDVIEGGSGDDTIYGGSGDDRVGAGAGNDAIAGDEGDDVMRGGKGDDWFFGSDTTRRRHGIRGAGRRPFGTRTHPHPEMSITSTAGPGTTSPAWVVIADGSCAVRPATISSMVGTTPT